VLLVVAPSIAAERSREVVAQFQREHLCPSTGKRWGACPGYVHDHINPRCNGGPDAVSNMQWQTIADAKIKDRREWPICQEGSGSEGEAPDDRLGAPSLGLVGTRRGPRRHYVRAVAFLRSRTRS
jgi:hypothetical protein